MANHTATATIQRADENEEVWQAVVVCSCGNAQFSSQHEDSDAAEAGAWSLMAEHLGYDPLDTEKTPEVAGDDA